MHVISQKKLRDFWEDHADARTSLQSWYRVAKKATWTTFNAVRESYRSADLVGKYVVFDICHNNYRLITHIHFNTKRIYIRHVLTHAEYERGRWKD